jgi:hypothetical protein
VLSRPRPNPRAVPGRFASSVHGPSRGTRRKRWTDTRRGFRLPIGRRSEELQANLQANWFHAWLRRKAPGNTRYGNRGQAAWTLGSEEVSTAGFYCEPARGSPSSLAVRPGRPSACRRSSSSASARRRSSSLWTAPRTIAESVLPGLEGAFHAPNSAGVRRTSRASDRRKPLGSRASMTTRHGCRCARLARLSASLAGSTSTRGRGRAGSRGRGMIAVASADLVYRAACRISGVSLRASASRP